MRMARLSLTLLLTLAAAGFAEERPAKLRVGVFDRPPFAIKDNNGRWIGIAVDLWEKVSSENSYSYEYLEVPMPDIITKLSRGELDLALGEIGVSVDRERKVDFTQPFLVATMVVAVPKHTSFANWRQILYGITHHGLIPVVLGMMGLLLIFSVLLWLLERRTAHSHFGGGPARGLGSALWFSAVTMTTVGYGDKTPQTPLGRLLAFLWMFLGILLVSAFTGSVASSITLAQLRASISEIDDLARFRDGVLRGSRAETMLAEAGIPAKKFESYQAGLRALVDEKITALAGDSVTLSYLIQREYPEKLKVVTFASTHVTFAMATRPQFPEMEALNISIVGIVSTPDWSRRLQSWLGSPPDGD